MVHLMKRVCAEPQCKQLAIITGDQSTRPGGSNVKCIDCRRSYCDRHRPAGMHTGCKTDTTFNNETPQTCSTSIACGLDLEEKRAQLKSAMKQRREMLRERRQRC
ncbi:hypothetical protein EG68_06738 [Paragonimus skrjabini miyazakii]|uniref:Uncharacterized protein n=1 Tax=Paragonimus skrjabini miyazakii TaxID=59628 RepID=A0A8S9YST3_9TREM|nr:hypothetical protein EG68_06738 [Paragonimus skrjabini miyazakii]